ncbi:kti12, chromatin associated, partial [Coemansia aciculifera]
ASAEKLARGALLSAVERLVSRETIVIADTPNYIKGLRYQLYCISREVSTTQCLVHCAISVDAAREINRGRGGDAYTEELFEELVMRYEEPNPAAKWDSPLFTVIQHDAADKLPFDAIWGAIVEQRAPPPNFSTAVKPVSETNYLFELDKMTLDIVNAILESQKSGVPTSQVVVPGTCDKVQMPGRNLTLSELRRYRMQFTKLNRQVPLKIDKIATQFSCDGRLFAVDEKTGFMSTLIKDIVDDLGATTEPIPLPNVTGDILVDIVRYCRYHKDDARLSCSVPDILQDDSLIEAWDRKFMAMTDNQMLKVIAAADYLNIEPLVDLGCLAVAKIIRTLSVEEIRQRYNVVDDFTPEQREMIKKELERMK